MARQIRFVKVPEIIKLELIIKACIYEVIEVEKAGLKINFKNTTTLNIPAEFEIRLKLVTGLKTAFCVLTPGRQKGYLLYFTGPKQSKTKEERVGK